MIKTDINNPAEPSKPLILLGVLKAYVSNPLLFLLKIKIKAGKLSKLLNGDYPAELIESVSLLSAIYLLLLKETDRERAMSITEAIAIPVGLSVQMANFRYTEDKRTFENLIKYQQRTNHEGVTKSNSMEIIDRNSNCYRFKVCSCMFMKAFTAIGVPELTPVICSVDNAIFNVYLPEKIIFHRDGIGNRIADGAEYCTFVCENREGL
jgi:hypothetical protein